MAKVIRQGLEAKLAALDGAEWDSMSEDSVSDDGMEAGDAPQGEITVSVLTNGGGGEDKVGEPSTVKQTGKTRKKAKRASKPEASVVPVGPPGQPSGVVYIGHIPHGFYEHAMKGFFKQFGDVVRVRISRSMKTGRCKGYAYVEFSSPEVAGIVAETMNGYYLSDKQLVCRVLNFDEIHPELFKDTGVKFTSTDWHGLYRGKYNADRTPEQDRKHVGKLVAKDKAKRKKLATLGIDYDFPGFVASLATREVAEGPFQGPTKPKGKDAGRNEEWRLWSEELKGPFDETPGKHEDKNAVKATTTDETTSTDTKRPAPVAKSSSVSEDIREAAGSDAKATSNVDAEAEDESNSNDKISGTKRNASKSAARTVSDATATVPPSVSTIAADKSVRTPKSAKRKAPRDGDDGDGKATNIPSVDNVAPSSKAMAALAPTPTSARTKSKSPKRAKKAPRDGEEGKASPAPSARSDATPAPTSADTPKRRGKDKTPRKSERNEAEATAAVSSAADDSAETPSVSSANVEPSPSPAARKNKSPKSGGKKKKAVQDEDGAAATVPTDGEASEATPTATATVTPRPGKEKGKGKTKSKSPKSGSKNKAGEHERESATPVPSINDDAAAETTPATVAPSAGSEVGSKKGKSPKSGNKKGPQSTQGEGIADSSQGDHGAVSVASTASPTSPLKTARGNKGKSPKTGKKRSLESASADEEVETGSTGGGARKRTPKSAKRSRA